MGEFWHRKWNFEPLNTRRWRGCVREKIEERNGKTRRRRFKQICPQRMLIFGTRSVRYRMIRGNRGLVSDALQNAL